MNKSWNLSELFINREACREALTLLDDKIESLTKENQKTLDKDSLFTILESYFECRELAYRCLVYGSICFYAETSKENAELKTTVEHKNEEIIGSLSFIQEMILNAGKEKVYSMIDENPDLEKYRRYIDELFRKKDHTVSSDEITETKKDIASLIQRYNDILKTVTFENITEEGKEIELDNGNIPKFLAARDRETRRQTYLSLNRGYEKVEDELVHLIDELYKKRAHLAKLLGYSSVIEMALDEEEIDPQIVESLIKIVGENKDLLQQYMKEKAHILKLTEPHLYDLGVPLDNGFKKKYPIEENLELLNRVFSRIGDEYTRTVHSLFDKGHIDLEIRENKHPITFSWYGYSFLNYHEAYGDLKNLVHEIGHSVNDILSLHLPFPYRISSVFTGETASIVNEILLNRTLLDETENEEEKLFYLSKEIDNYVTSVFRQIMYTEYESELYKRIESGKSLTKDFLEDTYTHIVKSYYGENIEYDPELKDEWMRLGHQIRWTFYSYQYATGLLIASAVATKLSSGELAESDYMEFLSAGFKESPDKLLKMIKIDYRDLSILTKGFEILKKDLEELVEFH